MHRHDESKKGLPLAAVEAPTIAVGTEHALLELGIGASGGDNTQDLVENKEASCLKTSIHSSFAALWRAW